MEKNGQPLRIRDISRRDCKRSLCAWIAFSDAKIAFQKNQGWRNKLSLNRGG